MIIFCLAFALNVCGREGATALAAEEDPLDRALRMLDSKDLDERRSAVSYLAFQLRPSKHFGDEKTPPPRKADEKPSKLQIALLKALSNADPEVRGTVAAILGSFEEKAELAIPTLAKLMLEDTVVYVRRSAAASLLKLGSYCKEVAPSLQKAKNDRDDFVKIYSTAAILSLGHGKPEDLQFLRKFANSKDDKLRDASMTMFKFIGLQSVNSIIAGLDDKDPAIRDWTVGAVTCSINRSNREQFPKDAIPLLIKAIDDENNDVAFRAIYTVSLLGPVAKDAIPAFIKRISDPDFNLRYLTIGKIVEFGASAEIALPALRLALKDKMEIIQVEASRSIKAIEELIVCK